MQYFCCDLIEQCLLRADRLGRSPLAIKAKPRCGCQSLLPDRRHPRTKPQLKLVRCLAACQQLLNSASFHVNEWVTQSSERDRGTSAVLNIAPLPGARLKIWRKQRSPTGCTQRPHPTSLLNADGGVVANEAATGRRDLGPAMSPAPAPDVHWSQSEHASESCMSSVLQALPGPSPMVARKPLAPKGAPAVSSEPSRSPHAHATYLFYLAEKNRTGLVERPKPGR